jgi:hypothetical protein
MDLTMETETDKREEQENLKAGLDLNHGNGLLQTEVDLPERDESIAETLDDDEHKHVDYSHYTKKELAELIKELSKENNFKKVDGIIREIKPLFDEFRDKEKSEALLRFTSDGGNAEDFEFKGDENDTVFDANLKLIRDRKGQYFKQQEDNKLENLRRKNEVIEKLRQLVDAQDHANQFEAFKELQKEWKTIGAVPGTQARTIWANYHALIDRFYDNQSIYFELKELDRKRNLEAKQELCVRAERLANVDIIKDAIRELNELHHEFKHIGPVPMDDKEQVWQRFKVASDAVYARRDTYLQKLQGELQTNLDEKSKLTDEVQAFISYQSDRIKDWNEKTKEILDIQKRWEVYGGLPRAKAKEINKKFWSAFKTFFNNKNNFFKKLDEERDHNLQLKNELVKRAHELKESHEWDKASNELKELQMKWKDIGPVPEKFREKVFKEFKEACDFFFEQKRGQQGKMENEQVENLKQKEAVCEEIENHVKNQTATLDVLDELQGKFNAIGFVPRKDISNIRHRFTEVVSKFIGSVQGLSEDEKNRALLETELNDLRNDPMGDKKIHHKEQAIRKKISKVEGDIAIWKNNLEFFGRSRNADKYKEEFNEKIREASEHLKQLKDQLKMLRTVS